jgi:ethanolamine utilization cobalamin adenosyltransferase
LKVITEIDLRDMYRKEPFESFTLVYPEKLTPAAFQFLTERRIRIIESKEGKSGGEASKGSENKSKAPVVLKEPEKGYLLLDSGRVSEEKPEAYTHLRGRTLVPKNHKRVVFRGKLDNLEANLINAILEIQCTGLRDLVNDLNIIFEYSKKIMRAEVLNEELQFIEFKGWSDSDIREYSHHPDKYFEVKHFVPDPRYGKVVASINIIRTLVRELEIAAVDAFYNEEEKTVEREDIIKALNRMSSLIYIIMCQYIGGFYKL